MLRLPLHSSFPECLEIAAIPKSSSALGEAMTALFHERARRRDRAVDRARLPWAGLSFGASSASVACLSDPNLTRA
jgi:hypothetical protein